MTIDTAVSTTVDAIKERLSPAVDTLDETVRHGRRLMIRGQHAAEDAAAAAALQIRRRPLSAVMTAAGAGVVSGLLFAFSLAWLKRRRE